ncbi:MAG: cobalamin-dependent protein, partial [Phycisphaerae bacterium]|nr:cobalamin-dependent protein [Phycisphaerae bacterium]
MNLLYVIPRYANSEVNYEFPLGLASVASYMKHKGFNVFCLNTCHHSGAVAEQISEWIHDKQIDMVCTGGISLHFDVIAEVFQAAKEVKKDILTVAGGPIISCDPQLALENMPIDFGIFGEGEETMAELITALSGETDVRDVRGLSFLDEQRNLVTTGPRDVITDLDRLPMPEYEAFDYSLFVSRAQA